MGKLYHENKWSIVLFVIFCILILSGCAQSQPQLKHLLLGTQYGFLGGLWHGFIAIFSLIGGIFNSDISVWSVNNDGGWYAFGFLLGVGAFNSMFTVRAVKEIK